MKAVQTSRSKLLRIIAAGPSWSLEADGAGWPAAYGIGYNGALYYVSTSGITKIGGSDIDAVAPGLDSTGHDEVFIHYEIVNALGVKVGMVGKYRPSTGLTPITDLIA